MQDWSLDSRCNTTFRLATKDKRTRTLSGEGTAHLNEQTQWKEQAAECAAEHQEFGKWLPGVMPIEREDGTSVA